MTNHTDRITEILEDQAKMRIAHMGVMVQDTKENLATHREANRAGYREWFGPMFRDSAAEGSEMGDVNVDSPITHNYYQTHPSPAPVPVPPTPQQQPPATSPARGLLRTLAPWMIAGTGIGGGLLGGGYLLAQAIANRPAPVQSVTVPTPETPAPQSERPEKPDKDTDTLFELRLLD